MIVTTHSPHITSVADPRGLVVFRGRRGQNRGGGGLPSGAGRRASGPISSATSTQPGRRWSSHGASSSWKVSPSKYCSQCWPQPRRIDLDKLGITVCAISRHPLRQLCPLPGGAADPLGRESPTASPIAEGGSNGQQRAKRLLKLLDREGASRKNRGSSSARRPSSSTSSMPSDDNADAFIDAMEEIGAVEAAARGGGHMA